MKCVVKRVIQSEKGQALVEFALVLPVFIFLVFGIIEFGRLWETVNIMTSASREGARAAAVSAPDMTPAMNAAQNVLTAGNVTNATINAVGPNGANEVVVTVTLNYTPLTGSIVPGIGPFSLTRSTTMRWEG
jgi:Flp pilus assembly protein TadG